MYYTVFFLFSLVFCAERADVYFTKIITPERIVDIFEKLNVELTGKIALKVHSGEPKGPYFLRPNFLQKIYDHTQGTFVECNVAYPSERLLTENHTRVLRDNGWLDNDRRFQIMDENPDDDISFTVEPHNKIDITYAGKHLESYDSCLVLAHFKGHGMGGFGGALKQLSIGFASTAGKTWIHSAGVSKDYHEFFNTTASQEDFTASMADAASAIVKYFKNKGTIAYINVIANISLSCDCAGVSAPAPKIKDIGILASTDPVAIDQASLDLVKSTQEEGTQDFINQVARLLGQNTIDKAEALGVGTKQYNLIDIDDESGSDTSDSDTVEPETGSPVTDQQKGYFISLSFSLIFLLLISLV